MMDKVAVVTGANKGIGYAIVKQLCKDFCGAVYLTARNQELGKKALDKLKVELNDEKQSEKLNFAQLDITDKQSITKLRDDLVSKFQGLDVLVNNAGIAYKRESTAPFGEQAQVTNKTNYFGTRDVCEILFPILKPHARVVNVSSTAGLLKQIRSEEVKKKFLDQNLTVQQLDDLIYDFIKCSQTNENVTKGYTHSAYGMSKIGVTALTFLQQKSFDDDSRPDIVVNACCPGYVDTDMTSHLGPLTPDEGAQTPVYLALLPPNVTAPKGAFVYQKRSTDWITGNFI